MIVVGLAWLQAPGYIHTLDDEVLHSFARHIRRAAGPDTIIEMRCFSHWGGKKSDPYIFPFMQDASGEFDLAKPNLAWDENVQRLRRIFWGTKMADGTCTRIWLRFDLFDNCGAKATFWWNFWLYNNNAFVDNMYDHNPDFLSWIKAEWIDRLWDLKIRRFSFGNELNYRGPLHVNQWVKQIVLPQAEYLLNKGHKTLIHYSGSVATSHAMRGWLEEIYGKNFACEIWHGQMLPERLPDRSSLMKGWPYGLSCDGLKASDGPGYTDSTTKEHAQSIRKFHNDVLWHPGKLVVAEHLIREIDGLQSPVEVGPATFNFLRAMRRINAG